MRLPPIRPARAGRRDSSRARSARRWRGTRRSRRVRRRAARGSPGPARAARSRRRRRLGERLAHRVEHERVEHGPVHACIGSGRFDGDRIDVDRSYRCEAEPGGCYREDSGTAADVEERAAHRHRPEQLDAEAGRRVRTRFRKQDLVRSGLCARDPAATPRVGRSTDRLHGPVGESRATRPPILPRRALPLRRAVARRLHRDDAPRHTPRARVPRPSLVPRTPPAPGRAASPARARHRPARRGPRHARGHTVPSSWNDARADQVSSDRSWSSVTALARQRIGSSPANAGRSSATMAARPPGSSAAPTVQCGTGTSSGSPYGGWLGKQLAYAR